MKRIDYNDRKVGDVGLCSTLGSIEGDLIRMAERELHPNAPADFTPSHAFIVGPTEGLCTEAWLQLGMTHYENSVAAINPITKWENGSVQKELWRPDGSPEYILTVLKLYIRKYSPKKYGSFNLLGFLDIAIVKELTGKDVENPFEFSQVCSQGAADYLQMLATESWFVHIDVRRCDPLGLRLEFLQNETH